MQIFFVFVWVVLMSAYTSSSFAQSGELRPCAGRKIALTFDDGPNAKTSPLVLSALKSFRAPATFFVNYKNGENGMAYAHTNKAIGRFLDEVDKSDLFDLGNHTGSHEQLIHLPPGKLLEQINLVKKNARYQEIVSKQSSELIRAPYGATGPGGSPRCQGRNVCTLMEDAGYKGHVHWHTDSRDWDRNIQRTGLKKYVMKELYTQCAKFPKKEILVVLFHDRIMNTARELPSILEAMKASGVEFVNLEAIQTNDVEVFEKAANGKLAKVRRHNIAWKAWKGPEPLLINEESTSYPEGISEHHE